MSDYRLTTSDYFCRTIDTWTVFVGLLTPQTIFVGLLTSGDIERRNTGMYSTSFTKFRLFVSKSYILHTEQSTKPALILTCTHGCHVYRFKGS